MAERTSHAEELDREAVADRLAELANAIRDEERTRVRVGNKNVDLDPPERLNYRIDVVEQQKLLRGNRETIKLELDWKPE